MNHSLKLYFGIAATALGALSAIGYLIFGIASGTFQGGIFACALVGTAIGALLLFYDGYFADFIRIAFVVVMTTGLLLLINNSIDDITAWMVGMGNYFGNADNVGPRLAIAVLLLLAAISGIVASFSEKRQKH